MDCQQTEILIAAVKKRPNLYDRAHPSYSNRGLLNNEWKKIAYEVGCTELAARKRWKKLRDYFQKNSRERAASGFKKKRWYLYNHLEFLIPFLDKLSKEVPGEEDVKADRDSLMEETFSFSHPGDTPVLLDLALEDRPRGDEAESTSHIDGAAVAAVVATATVPEPQDGHPSEYIPVLRKQRPVKRKYHAQQRREEELELEADTETVRQPVLMPDRGREERGRHTDTDEDEHFFKSLLPKLRMLKTIDKMECQAEIHAVVLKYIKKINGFSG